MKLLTYDDRGEVKVGAAVGDAVLDLAAATGRRFRPPLQDMLPDGDAMAEARELADRAVAEAEFAETFCRPLQEVRIMAPIVRPGKVICLGLNYRDHAVESGHAVPSEPVVFSKLTTSVIGPDQPIRIPQASDQIDYEVELAVVVGRRAKGLSATDAMSCVAGYTVLTDVSARDYQREKPGGQWTLAKSFDTFCPIGPGLVTPDEVSDPHRLRIECAVNGELLQSSNTAQMIFSVPEIIEYINRVVTLEPGDVVATGTPAGVGFARRPPRFLHAGDVVECTVQDVGTLVNPVV